MDDLGDLALEDQAPCFGIGLGYLISPRPALWIDGDLVLFAGESEDDQDDGDPAATPAMSVDMRFLHYTAGLDFELTPPGRGPWDVTLQAGVGGTTWDTDSFAGSTGQVDFNKTYATLRGGLSVGHDLSPRVSVLLRSQASFVFGSEQDTEILAPLFEPENEAADDDDPASAEEEFIGTALSVPLYLGFRNKLQEASERSQEAPSRSAPRLTRNGFGAVGRTRPVSIVERQARPREGVRRSSIRQSSGPAVIGAHRQGKRTSGGTPLGEAMRRVPVGS